MHIDSIFSDEGWCGLGNQQNRLISLKTGSVLRGTYLKQTLLPTANNIRYWKRISNSLAVYFYRLVWSQSSACKRTTWLTYFITILDLPRVTKLLPWKRHSKSTGSHFQKWVLGLRLLKCIWKKNNKKNQGAVSPVSELWRNKFK